MNKTTNISDRNCLEEWCEGEEWCPVTCTMEIINRKWHPVIIYRLLDNESLRFNELSNNIDTITNKVLTESLKDLQKKDLIERITISKQPAKVEYTLTDRGRSLEPIINSLEEWGKKHLNKMDSQEKSTCL